MFAISYMKEQIVRRSPMAYTLKEFCADSHALLTSGSRSRRRCRRSPRGSGRLLSAIRTSWPKPSTTTRRSESASSITIPTPTSTCSRTCRRAGRPGKPHSHGASWAIYGNARARHRDDRVASRQSGERGARRARAGEQNYRLGPGQTRAYGPGVIHSTAHPEKAWVIRVTGTDLDGCRAIHFRKQDRIWRRRERRSRWPFAGARARGEPLTAAYFLSPPIAL